MTNYLLENLAAESDYRTTCIDEKWWESIKGNEALYDNFVEKIWVPIRFEVCPSCEGRGKYVNPSIDAHGLTRDDFDEDEDFRDSYFAGDYDITCKLCAGEKVIPVPTDKEMAKEIQNRLDENYYSRQEQLAEIAAGC